MSVQIMRIQRLVTVPCHDGAIVSRSCAWCGGKPQPKRTQPKRTALALAAGA